MLDGYLFAVGGSGGWSEQSMERYDPNTDTWQLMEGVGLKDHFDNQPVVALDGELYFMGMEQIDAVAGSACWVS